MSKITPLTDWLESQASWRTQVAKKHDDPKSEDQARRLRRAVREWDALPDDDRLAVAVAKQPLSPEGMLVPSDAIAEIVRTWGRYRGDTTDLLRDRLLGAMHDQAQIQAWERQLQGLAAKLSWRLQRTRRGFDGDIDRLVAYKLVDRSGIAVLGDDDAPVSLSRAEAFVRDRVRQTSDE